jgi:hypothetical protein
MVSDSWALCSIDPETNKTYLVGLFKEVPTIEGGFCASIGYDTPETGYEGEFYCRPLFVEPAYKVADLIKETRTTQVLYIDHEIIGEFTDMIEFDSRRWEDLMLAFRFEGYNIDILPK